MALIKIIELPGGKTACGGYFYRTRTAGMSKTDCCIAPGETAEVDESDLDMHLSTGMVMVVKESNPAKPKVKPRKKRAKAVNKDDEKAILSARRD